MIAVMVRMNGEDMSRAQIHVKSCINNIMPNELNRKKKQWKDIRSGQGSTYSNAFINNILFFNYSEMILSWFFLSRLINLIKWCCFLNQFTKVTLRTFILFFGEIGERRLGEQFGEFWVDESNFSWRTQLWLGEHKWVFREPK